MSLKVLATLVCDAQRTPGCHREYAAEADSAPACVSAVVKEARSAGWFREYAGGHVVGDDVCPSCAGAAAAARRASPA